VADEDTALFITRLGEPGSSVRSRTDDVQRYIVEPVLEQHAIRLIRSDQDPNPGRITDRLVEQIIAARLVVADTTGLNPNVFYELNRLFGSERGVAV
jgi:hypothetical protein